MNVMKKSLGVMATRTGQIVHVFQKASSAQGNFESGTFSPRSSSPGPYGDELQLTTLSCSRTKINGPVNRVRGKRCEV